MLSFATLGATLALCVLPYLLPDAGKIALASALVLRLYPFYMKGQVFP